MRTSLIAFIVAAALPASAAVSTRVNFQGRLIDPTTKNPRTEASADLTFRLYDASSGGTLLWTEGPTTVTLDNGVFETQLGAVTALSSAAFLAAQTWLEIQVESETLAPRQRLVAAPTALRAAAADYLEPGSTNYVQNRVTVQSGAVFYTSSGSVSGTFTVYGALQAAGDLRVDGVIRAGSGSNQITTAAGLLDAAKLDAATFVPNAALDASSVTKIGNSVNGVDGPLRLDGAGLVPNALLDSSSVTKQGNGFNAANKLLQLDGAGLVPNTLISVSSVARLAADGYLPDYHHDPASVTLQGNGFNAASKLLQLDGGGLVPNTLLSVSSVARLAADGYLPDYQHDPTSVTLQGNGFNAALKLVQLDASATLNAPGAGNAVYSLATSSSINITGTGAKVREAGSDIMPKDAIILWPGTACPPGFTEYTSLRGRVPLGNCSGCTVGTTGGAVAAYTADGQTQTHAHDASATAGTIRKGAGNFLTDAVDTGMPYIQLLFCQKS